MSVKIDLGGIPSSPEEREQLLAKKVLQQERGAQHEVNFLQKRMIDFLIDQKGYSQEDIQVNRAFQITLPSASFQVRADITLTVNGTVFLTVKCTVDSLESWERQSLAFCRVALDHQIPYAVITDGISARLIKTLEGETAAGMVALIPSKSDAATFIESVQLPSYPEEKGIKEKRILHAFAAITCSPE